jgi:hypothetical protein
MVRTPASLNTCSVTLSESRAHHRSQLSQREFLKLVDAFMAESMDGAKARQDRFLFRFGPESRTDDLSLEIGRLDGVAHGVTTNI